MEMIREDRRVSIVGSNGLKLRRRRTAGGRGFSDEDMAMDLQESESSEASINEEDEDFVGAAAMDNGHRLRQGYLQPRKRLSPGSSSSSSSLKIFRPGRTWKTGEEMMDFSVPRKARSACAKRFNGNGLDGEQFCRRTSSPSVRQGRFSMPATATSPSSSNPPTGKKLKLNNGQKLKLPAISKMDSSNPEELEIEIAEVLFGLKDGDGKSLAYTPISESVPEVNPSPGNLSASVPKGKKQEPVPAKPETDMAVRRGIPFSTAVKTPGSVSVTGGGVILRQTHLQEMKVQEFTKMKPTAEELSSIGVTDSPSTGKKEATLKSISDIPEVNNSGEDKSVIDLLCRREFAETPASAGKNGVSVRSHENEPEKKPERDGAAVAGKKLHHQIRTPPFEIAKEVPLFVKPLTPATAACPGGFPPFSPPQPKRCATHCYIARSINYLQRHSFRHGSATGSAGRLINGGEKPLPFVPSSSSRPGLTFNLAILPNNGYPFPVQPVGASVINGSFYSSSMAFPAPPQLPVSQPLHVHQSYQNVIPFHPQNLGLMTRSLPAGGTDHGRFTAARTDFATTPVSSPANTSYFQKAPTSSMASSISKGSLRTIPLPPKNRIIQASSMAAQKPPLILSNNQFPMNPPQSHLFFSNPLAGGYTQARWQNPHHQLSVVAAPSSAASTVTNDPAEAIAVAAWNAKGGGQLRSQGIKMMPK